MNKAERAQRNVWRDQAIRAVEQARAEEAARTQDERGKVAKRQFLMQRARELLNFSSLAGDELGTIELWISKKITGRTPARNPDAPRIAPRYEAWPVEGEIPEWLRKRFADEHWLWNALALPVQHTIWRICGQQSEAVAAIYKEAEAKGLDTNNGQARKKLGPRIKAALRKVDYSPLKQILKARDAALEEADLIRKGKIADPEAEMRRLEWSRANWNFALAVSKLPAWLQRIVEDRLNAASKARRARREAGAGDKWSRGYPKPDPEEHGGEGRLDVYFNNQNLAWCVGEMRNSYVDISAPWNPPDHRGPRKGKYRSLREMRKVTIYEPGASAKARTKKENKNRFSLNVLFHSVPAGARMKACKLRAESGAGGKLRWFFIPTFELACADGAERRTFAGIDMGWRASGEEDFKHVHSWSEESGYQSHEVSIAANRWSRRYNARQARMPAEKQFPIETTPDGLRDFASRKSALQRDLKMKMGEVLEQENLLPANWDRIGRRRIARLMTHEKSPEYAALQCLRPDYDAWARRDGELARIYRAA